MTVFALERRTVPVRIDHGAPLCGARGFCGPFANQAYYNAFPEAFWHGMGDCVHCGTTRHAGNERERALEVQTAA